jgi:hypothetical protein
MSRRLGARLKAALFRKSRVKREPHCPFSRFNTFMAKAPMIGGATCLVGGHVLNLVLRDLHMQEVITLIRRQLAVDDSKIEQILIDFDELATLTPSLHEIRRCD